MCVSVHACLPAGPPQQQFRSLITGSKVGIKSFCTGAAAFPCLAWLYSLICPMKTKHSDTRLWTKGQRPSPIKSQNMADSLIFRWGRGRKESRKKEHIHIIGRLVDMLTFISTYVHEQTQCSEGRVDPSYRRINFQTQICVCFLHKCRLCTLFDRYKSLLVTDDNVL